MKGNRWLAGLAVAASCSALLVPLGCMNGCDPPRYRPNTRPTTSAPQGSPHAPFAEESAAPLLEGLEGVGER